MTSSKNKQRFYDFMTKHVEPPLCGIKSPLGDFAEWATTWTEKEYPEGLPAGTTMKCWCCAFWRGVVVGLIGGICLCIIL